MTWPVSSVPGWSSGRPAMKKMGTLASLAALMEVALPAAPAVITAMASTPLAMRSCTLASSFSGL